LIISGISSQNTELVFSYVYNFFKIENFVDLENYFLQEQPTTFLIIIGLLFVVIFTGEIIWKQYLSRYFYILSYFVYFMIIMIISVDSYFWHSLMLEILILPIFFMLMICSNMYKINYLIKDSYYIVCLSCVYLAGINYLGILSKINGGSIFLTRSELVNMFTDITAAQNILFVLLISYYSLKLFLFSRLIGNLHNSKENKHSVLLIMTISSLIIYIVSIHSFFLPLMKNIINEYKNYFIIFGLLATLISYVNAALSKSLHKVFEWHIKAMVLMVLSLVIYMDNIKTLLPLIFNLCLIAFAFYFILLIINNTDRTLGLAKARQNKHLLMYFMLYFVFVVTNAPFTLGFYANINVFYNLLIMDKIIALSFILIQFLGPISLYVAAHKMLRNSREAKLVDSCYFNINTKFVEYIPMIIIVGLNILFGFLPEYIE
jgi:hypothetical protein